MSTAAAARGRLPYLYAKRDSHSARRLPGRRPRHHGPARPHHLAGPERSTPGIQLGLAAKRSRHPRLRRARGRRARLAPDAPERERAGSSRARSSPPRSCSGASTGAHPGGRQRRPQRLPVRLGLRARRYAPAQSPNFLTSTSGVPSPGEVSTPRRARPPRPQGRRAGRPRVRRRSLSPPPAPWAEATARFSR